MCWGVAGEVRLGLSEIVQKTGPMLPLAPADLCVLSARRRKCWRSPYASRREDRALVDGFSKRPLQGHGAKGMSAPS